MNDVSLIKEAREIVRCQPPSKKVEHLRSWADALDEAWRGVTLSPSRGNIVRMCQCSTKVIRAIEDITAAEPPPHLGGAIRPNEMQRVA
jgi:hypothetical protein